MLRRRLAFLAIIYIVVMYISLYGKYDGFLLLLFICGMVVSSAILSLITKNHIKIEVFCDDAINRRMDKSMIKVKIHNPSFFPVNFGTFNLGIQGSSKKIEFAAEARRDAFSFAEYVFEHCGVYEISVRDVYVFDYFKLFKFRIKSESVVSVTVLPRLFSWDDSAPAMDGNTGLKGVKGAKMLTFPDRAGDDNSELFDIREYRDGDSLKNIHHKLSSRMDKLMVKEYAFPSGSGLVFAILFAKMDVPDREKINDNLLDSMYAIMTQALKRGMAFLGLYESIDTIMTYDISSQSMLEEYFTLLIEGDSSAIRDEGFNTVDKLATILSDSANSVDRNLHLFASNIGEREYELGYRLVRNLGTLTLWLPQKEVNKAKEFAYNGITVKSIIREEA